VPPRDDRDRDARDEPPRDDRGGRPRLVLKARSKDAPAAAGGGGGGGLFGGARPREAALKEAGRDFIKEDLALSRGAGVRRKKHADEKAIEEDIAKMREELAGLAESEAETKASLTTTIGEAETALAKLTLELDDKVRFAQRDGAAARGGGDRSSEKEGGEERESHSARGNSRRDERERGSLRERDLDRGWGEGKTERGGGGGRDAKARGEKTDDAASNKTKNAPRAPRVLVAAEPEAVKIAPSGFAALAIEDE
jgi:TAG lipase/steryl ester hydrolase/phospholipase A2/LPA acyltransferase